MTSEPVVGIHKAGASRMPVWEIFLIFYGTALLLCMLDLVDGVIYFGDIDDQMRATQIRSLMSPAGHWWDMTLPMIAMPEPYLSPWSRLVDFPYAVIAYGLAPVMGQAAALSVAFHVWPPLLLAAYCLCAASVFHRFSTLSPAAARPLARLLVVVAAVLMVFSIWEFVPGRIDHHNAQLVALAVIFAGLSRWDGRGGSMIGIGSLVSVAISLEGLPFVVMAYGGLAAAVFMGHRQAIAVLKAACWPVIVLTLPLAFLLTGPVGIVSTQCDAFSMPYMLLLVGCCVILGIFADLAKRRRLWLAALVSVASIAVLAVVAVSLFPECRAGPYWMIDPVSKAYWLDRIGQESGSLQLIREGQFALVAFEGLMACLLIVAAPLIGRQVKAGRLDLVVVWSFAALSLLLAILLARYVRFAFAFTPLMLPIVYAALKTPGAIDAVLSSRDRNLMIAGIGLVVAGVVAAFALVRPREIVLDAPTFMSYDTCEGGDLSLLSAIPDGRIIAPEGLSKTLLPLLRPGLSIASVPFHRAAPGMRRTFDAFLSEKTEVRRQALAPFDYLAVCRFPLKADDGTAPLYDALSDGRDWPGLIRLPTGAENPFQLFRIDHAALQ